MRSAYAGSLVMVLLLTAVIVAVSIFVQPFELMVRILIPVGVLFELAVAGLISNRLLR
jgi:hypothetical protein